MKRSRLPVLLLSILLATACSGENKSRVVVVGVDGADWRIIDALIEQGRLPAIERLRSEGATGPLYAPDPLLSPILWTSIGTGRSAVDHGIVGFLTVRDGVTQPVGGDERKVPALWEIASAYDLRSTVLGWYTTWPAEKIQGVIVADRAAPHQVQGDAETSLFGSVHPSSWQDPVLETLTAVRKEIRADTIPEFFAPNTEDGRDQASEALLVDSLRTTELWQRLFFRSWEKGASDLSMVYFEVTDSVGHLYARYQPPALGEASPSRKARYAESWFATYDLIDRFLLEILETLDPSRDTLIVCSDHGFASGSERPLSFDRLEHADDAPLWHLNDGVVALWGRGIVPGQTIADATIYDIAPTVLSLLELPLADNLRGKPMAAALDPGLLSEAPHSVPEYPQWERSYVDTEVLEEDATEAIARLEALGYLSSGDGSSKDASVEGQLAIPLNRYNRGKIFSTEGRSEEAIEIFASLVRDHPDFEPGYLGLVQELSSAGRKQEALEFMRRLPIENIELTPLHELHAQLALEAGEKSEAREAIRRARSTRRRATLVDVLGARLALETGDLSATASLLDDLFEDMRRPFSSIEGTFIAPLYEQYAEATLQTGDKAETRAALRRARETRGRSARIDLLSARLAIEGGDLDEASQMLDDLLDGTPEKRTEADAWVLRGEIEQTRNSAGAARETYQRATEIDPSLRTAHQHAIQLEISLQEFARADLLCDRYLPLERTRGDAAAALEIGICGRAAGAAGKVDKAAQLFRESLALNPDQPKLHAMLSALK